LVSLRGSPVFGEDRPSFGPVKHWPPWGAPAARPRQRWPALVPSCGAWLVARLPLLCRRCCCLCSQCGVCEKAGPVVRPFSLCARQGALTGWLKSNAGPARGTASRTARVSIARWNLKEAAGKTLVRRTETTYEAHGMGAKANVFQARSLSGNPVGKCRGHKRGGQCALPGEISDFAIKLAASQGADEEAGEVSRGHSRSFDRPKGRTEEAERNLFLRERSSARKAG